MSTPQTSVPAKTSRTDIPSLPVDGDLRRDKLKGARPDMDYVFVDKRQELSGVNDHRARGFKVVKYGDKAGEPTIRPPDVQDGDEVTQLGTVLMARPKELRDAEYNAQQARADAVDKQILKSGGIGVPDGIRGKIGLKAQTTALEREE